MTIQKRKPLGEILVQLGLASSEDVRQALDLQKQGDQRPLGQIILAQTNVSSEEIAKALAQQFSMEFVDLDRTTIDSAAVDLVPRAFAWEHILLPYRYDCGKLYVAVFDPIYLEPLQQIQQMTQIPTVAVLATIEAVDRALRRCYSGSPTQPSPLRPPPLSQRQTDLRRLIGLFLKDFSSQSGRIMKISRMALQTLLGHDWQSVRALLDAVESACKAAPNDVIRMEHLPEFLRTPQPSEPPAPGA